jgi:uncharacterized protein
MQNYIPRLIETSISRELSAIGCVSIEGPKWCGKSTTAELFAKTVIKLQNPIIFTQYSAFASTSKENLLRGEKPILFDEWQKIPEIWDFIRTDIDETRLIGQYLLTGSSKPSKAQSRHTGTGRIAKLTMYPMSLWESSDSVGSVSLYDLFYSSHAVLGQSKITLDEIAFVICRGGWPQAVLRPDQALILSQDYFNSLTTEDISDVDDIKRNPRRAREILRSYARNICSFASTSTLLSDVASNDSTMDIKTLTSYIIAFEKLFVIDNIAAWTPALRSKSVIRAANKRQFIDPSIAAAALGAKPNDLINDLKTFGFFFESLCHRDLKIYANSMGGELYHYHDSYGLEIDGIIHLSDGKWGAVEIKLGGNEIEQAANNLLCLKNRVNSNLGDPSFLMVLTGAPYAYKRTDGVIVVPIGCLKN